MTRPVKIVTSKLNITRRALTDEAGRLFRFIDQHHARLDPFPRGDEFFGRISAVRESQAHLNLMVMPIVGIERLSSGEAVNLVGADFQPVFYPLILDQMRTEGRSGLVLTLRKPGNYVGHNLAPSPGDLLSTQQASHPFRRRILADYDAKTVTVYQAFKQRISDQAVALQKFGDLLSPSRMTWIKTSFLWMMNRSKWGQKEGQERILAITLLRTTFVTLLRLACIADPVLGLYYQDEGEYQSEALKLKDRIQWDPDKTIDGKRKGERAIQIGIHPENHALYNEGIQAIKDITSLAKLIKVRCEAGEEGAASEMPAEVPYPTPIDLLKRLEMHQYYISEGKTVMEAVLRELT